MKRKTISLVALFLALSLFIRPISVQCSIIFKDVKETDWFYRDVMDAYNSGFLVGSNGYFGVNDPITYAQFIKSMVIIKWPNEVRPLNPNENWAVPYIEVAIKHGLILDGEIQNYNSPCLREKMFVYLCKTLGLEPDTSEPIFIDTVGKPEAGYINTAYNEYLTEGGGGGAFAYGSIATRAQLATMVMKTYKYNLDPSSFKIAKATERKATLNKLISSGKNPYSLQTMRFFASGNTIPVINSRVYKQEFPVSTSEYINWEIGLITPIFETNKDITVKQIYYDSQGNVFASHVSDKGEYSIIAKMSTCTLSWGLGIDDGSTWPLGTYRVEVFIDGFKVANSSFQVTEGNKNKVVLSTKEIAQKNNAVVLINTYDNADKPIGSGSGFFVSADGRLITNYHVIDGASRIEIITSKNEKFQINTVCSYSASQDIAVLKVTSSRSLPCLTLGDSDLIELGEDIVAIGSPLGLTNTVSTGIISSMRKNMVRIANNVIDIQISAPISHGSSGGALFNVYGEVIGITYAGLGDYGGENLNFAIPINEITPYINQNFNYTLAEIYEKEHVINYDDGSKYTGDISNGHPNGSGIMLFADGDSYSGDWLNGVRDGYGIYKWKEGTKYEGYFKEGLLHGEGIYSFTDGAILFGTWHQGKLNGLFKYYDKKGLLHWVEYVDDVIYKLDGIIVSN